MPDRIDYDDRGELDDVVIEDVRMFRLERMSGGHFWLCCYRDGKPSVSFWLHSPRKISGSHEMLLPPPGEIKRRILRAVMDWRADD